MAESTSSNYIYALFSLRNKRIVLSMIEKIISDGISVQYDDTAETDDNPSAKGDKFLRDAKMAIVFISRAFAEGQRCLVELSILHDTRKSIVPVFLDCTSFPDYLPADITPLLASGTGIYCRTFNTSNLLSDKSFYNAIYKGILDSQRDPAQKQVTPPAVPLKATTSQSSQEKSVQPKTETAQTNPVLDLRDSSSSHVSTQMLDSMRGGWGPQRTVYKTSSRPHFATINSIIDNPTIGDERAFIYIGEINADKTSLARGQILKPGKKYLVYVYVHNDADPAYNIAAEGFAGIARNTHVSIVQPDQSFANNIFSISALVSWEYSDPERPTMDLEQSHTEVWSSVNVMSEHPITIEYVSGSAKIRFGDTTRSLPDALFSKEGTIIGHHSNDGYIYAGDEHHAVITYQIQVFYNNYTSQPANYNSLLQEEKVLII